MLVCDIVDLVEAAAAGKEEPVDCGFVGITIYGITPCEIGVAEECTVAVGELCLTCVGVDESDLVCQG